VTLYERFEKLSDDETSTRRRLLSRAAKACLGAAVAVAGLSRVGGAGASTSGAGCCVLAYQNECPNCSGHGYDCAAGCTRWAWYCVDSAHRYWICGECYSGSSCSGCSCGHVVLATNSRNVPPLGAM
jgi:hypothetical protein